MGRERQAAGGTLTVVDERTSVDHVTTLDRRIWSRLHDVAEGTGVAGAHLVFAHGGLWIDIDCIAIGPLTYLIGALTVADVSGRGGDAGGSFFLGMFAARPQSPFIGEWIQVQERLIWAAHDSRDLTWTGLGSDITSPLVRRFGYFSWPGETVEAVHWRQRPRFTSRLESPERIMVHEPVTVMPYNEITGRYFGSMTRRELLRQQTLLSRLFRISLDISSCSDEADRLAQVSALARLRFSQPAMRAELWITTALGESNPWQDN